MNLLRSITLPESGITTTSVGFGCNALLGSDNTRRQALALLETAYDAGVRHFDVARSYEAGDSEDVLGEFARNKRDKITITTKFRINNPGDYHGGNPTKAWLRRQVRSSAFVLGLRPLLKKAFGRGEAPAPTSTNQPVPAPVDVAPKPFERVDIDLARRSLENSLCELKTSYVDLLFVHEGEESDCQPELLEFLQKVKQEGKVRQFGVGSAFFRTKILCERMPEFTPVVQFESSLLEPHVAKIAALGKRGISTHGAMASLSRLRDRLQSDAGFAARFTEIINADWRDAKTLPTLLLQYALYENPDGIVLFRSANPEKIRANVSSLSERSFSNAQFQALEQLVAEFGKATSKETVQAVQNRYA